MDTRVFVNTFENSVNNLQKQYLESSQMVKTIDGDGNEDAI